MESRKQTHIQREKNKDTQSVREERNILQGLEILSSSFNPCGILALTARSLCHSKRFHFVLFVHPPFFLSSNIYRHFFCDCGRFLYCSIIHTRIHTHPHTHTHTHACTHTHTPYTCARIHTHTHTHTQRHPRDTSRAKNSRVPQGE